MKETINLFVSSREEADRKNIISILSEQNNFRITGIEKEEAGTIIKSENLKPDVIILDFQPPGMSGCDLAPIIRRKSPSTFIILLSDKDEENITHLVLKAGVSGILLKNTDMNILIPVIEIVNSGGYYFSTSILIRILNIMMYRRHLAENTENQNDTFFTSTERGIIIDIALGFSDGEIAGHYHLSPGTIKNYIMVIKRKLNAKNRFQIIIYALENGLISYDQVCFKTMDIF